MKLKTNALIAVATSFLLGSVAMAEQDKHDHDHEHAHEHAISGPNGGRVLHDVDPHAELFVTKDRKIQITFLDAEGKAVAPGNQSISVICGKRSSPTRMSFAKEGSSFLSDKALPAGMNIPTVVQIKMTPDGKKETIKLNLNLEECPTCDFLEYACTCEHDKEDE